VQTMERRESSLVKTGTGQRINTDPQDGTPTVVTHSPGRRGRSCCSTAFRPVPDLHIGGQARMEVSFVPTGISGRPPLAGRGAAVTSALPAACCGPKGRGHPGAGVGMEGPCSGLVGNPTDIEYRHIREITMSCPCFQCSKLRLHHVV
jgi:hypothetical protein